MKQRRVLWVFILSTTVLFVITLASRNSLLQWAFKREQAHFKTVYHLNVSAAVVKFNGWNGIELSAICIQPDSADTLAVIQKLAIKPNLLSLLTGKIAFNQVKIDTALITVFNEDGKNNLSFLKAYKTETKSHTSIGTNYYLKAEDLKERALKILNVAFDIHSLQINYRDTTFVEQINVPCLTYNLHTLSGLVINQQLNDTLSVKAEVVDKNRDYKIAIQHQGNVPCYLPFMDAEHKFKCRFQSVTAEIKLKERGNELQITSNLSTQSFTVQHWRLAKGDVVFPVATFNGLVKINEAGVELDSSSVATLNHVPFKLFAAFQTKPDTIFALNINIPETVSDTFFNALPIGMFNTLKGISCSGTLAYSLQFKMNTRQPDSLVFESQLKRKDFRIIHNGEENYARINEPFVYDAFSGDQFVRHIMVGPENAEFAQLNRITPYLMQAILESEDPSFMRHRGFVAESFRQSIAQNYKEGRFARGGSTISMQLVKNVFLTRNKTISRKAEEALIVYLVENLGLVSKERMMEVYLNVIEWGPNVYGATEAARFYFNKTPAQLSLQECIFLAAIIPRPRYFKYQFNSQGEIKSYMADYFKIIIGRMALRGYLAQGDTTGFVPQVKLTGPALRQVMPADSMVPDIDEDFPAVE